MAEETAAGLLTVEQARARVLDLFAPLETERLPVSEASGRCLAAAAVAPEHLPRFDNSSMDGYAIHRSDLQVLPARLKVVGETRAGGATDLPLERGCALRIMTGAPMPPGATGVAPIEIASESDGVVEISSLPPSSYIRPAGDDVHRGETIVPAGVELAAGELALLASMGLSPVTVHRRPRVACVTTGDELVASEDDPGPGQIRDSNAVALRALVEAAGGEVSEYVRIPDDFEAVASALTAAAATSDLVVSAGGVSVGRYDYVRDVLHARGRVDLWRVAMQPGKPLLAGMIHDTGFIGLPGNPVSVHIGFEQFVRPALRKMLGCLHLTRPVVKARLSDAIGKPPGRLHFVRVRLEWDEGTVVATPTGPQGSHIQSSLVGCDGLLRFEQDDTALKAGELVTVEVWRLPQTL